MNSAINEKSTLFAIRVIKFCRYLVSTKAERLLTNQLLRSGTSIGANVRESINAASKKDFINKMTIALKEANETEYWLELLFKTDTITEQEFSSINSDCKELVKLLVSIVKTSKNSIPE